MSPAAKTSSFELIDVEVHQKSIRNIASEMAITLMRTSGSPVVTEAKDFSTCILDAKLEQLAFSGYVTFHIATAVPGVEAVLRNVPIEEIAPGDAFICNDPHTSGAIHQGDIGIVMPFFFEDDQRSFLVTSSQGVNLGNKHIDIDGGLFIAANRAREALFEAEVAVPEGARLRADVLAEGKRVNEAPPLRLAAL